MGPLVSVIIPAYNAQRFISETLESVLAQTYTNFEVLVVDDGSGDEQNAVIATFVNRDKRVKYFHQVNAGVSAARNKGFRESNGELIAFLDADDVWLPMNLEVKVKSFQGSDVGLVHSDAITIDEHSCETETILSGTEGDVLDDLLLWDGTQIPGPSSAVIARRALQAVGVFDEAMSTAADKELFIRIAKEYRVARIDKITWKYRIHSDNMHKNIPAMERDVLYLYNKARTLSLFKSKQFERRCFASMYLILAACWAGEGRNIRRCVAFLLMAIKCYPPVLVTVTRKMIKRCIRK